MANNKLRDGNNRSASLLKLNSGFKRKRTHLITSELYARNIAAEIQNLQEIQLPELKTMIIHILTKDLKAPSDICKLTYFLSKIQKLVQCIKELHSNYLELLYKISFSVKFQHLQKNRILFRACDLADKFFFIIKGKVAIIIKQELYVNMHEYEYLDYLLMLKSHNESSLINTILSQNKRVYPLDFVTFDEFLDELYLISSGRSKYNYMITSFIREKPIYTELKDKVVNLCKKLKKTFINSKTLRNSKSIYSPEKERLSKTLKVINYCGIEDDCEITVPNYCDQFIPKEILLDDINASLYMEEKYHSMQKQLKFKSPTKAKEGGLTSPDRNANQFNTENMNIDSNNQLVNLEANSGMCKGGLLKIINASLLKKKVNINDKLNFEYMYSVGALKRHQVKIYSYFQVNSIGDMSVFGDLGMNKHDGERTASVITLEDSYFGFLTTQDYKSHIKECFDKKNKLNLSFLSEYGLFNSFLVKNEDQILNYFFLKEYSLKAVVFEECSKNLYLVKEGTFRLSINSSLSQLDGYIRRLSGDSKILNNAVLVEDLESNFRLHEYYTKVINIPLYETTAKDVINIELLDISFLRKVREMIEQLNSNQIVEEEMRMLLCKEFTQNKGNNTLDFKLECTSQKGEVFTVKYEDFYSKIFKHDILKIEDYIFAKNRCMAKRLTNVKETKMRHFYAHYKPYFLPEEILGKIELSNSCANIKSTCKVPSELNNQCSTRSFNEQTESASVSNQTRNQMRYTMTTNFSMYNSKILPSKKGITLKKPSRANFSKLNLTSSQADLKTKLSFSNLKNLTSPVSLKQKFDLNIKRSDRNKKHANEVNLIVPRVNSFAFKFKNEAINAAHTNLPISKQLNSMANGFSPEYHTARCATGSKSFKFETLLGGQLALTDYDYPRESHLQKLDTKKSHALLQQYKIKLTQKNIANAQMEIFRPKKAKGNS